MYKLIVSDVDGTLIGHNFEMPAENAAAIAKAVAAGVVFTLCSGRSYKSLKTIHSNLGLPKENSFVMGFNGAIVYDIENEAVVYQKSLGADISLAAAKFFKEKKRKVEIFVYKDAENVMAETDSTVAAAYAKISELGLHLTDDILGEVAKLDSPVKVIFLGANEDLKVFKEEISQFLKGQCEIFFSSEFMVELGPLNSNKGEALKWLCTKLNIDISQAIAIGDNYNDMEMVSVAGLGVAVANAVDALKAAAAYTTEKTGEDAAVAEVINKFILNGN